MALTKKQADELRTDAENIDLDNQVGAFSYFVGASSQAFAMLSAHDPAVRGRGRAASHARAGVVSVLGVVLAAVSRHRGRVPARPLGARHGGRPRRRAD